jgi:hypothetical protein
VRGQVLSLCGLLDLNTRLTSPRCTQLLEGASGAAAVSHATGRADALFSRLSFDARCALRIDDVAAYSVMDDASAQDMAALTAAVTAAACGLPWPPAGTQGGNAQLRLSCADVTACCGGTTMALAGAFASVTAVEIDSDRADDLDWNLRVAGLAVRRITEGDLPAAASPGSPGSPSSSGGGKSGGGSCGCGSGESSNNGGGGRVAVLCGDAVHLLERLGPHDCFVLDPPWGGPQYLEAAAADEEEAASLGAEAEDAESDAEEGGDGCSSSAVSGSKAGKALAGTASSGGAGPAARGSRRKGKPPVVSDMPLGGESLAAVCARLQGMARTAVLRLPSRGFDFDAFAAAVLAQCAVNAGAAAAPAPLAAANSGGIMGANVAPLVLSAEFGRSRLLIVVYGGALRAAPPPPPPPGGRARGRWQLLAACNAVECAWRLPEPCSVFVPEGGSSGSGAFVRCERCVRCVETGGALC